MESQGSQVLISRKESGATKTVGLISDTHVPVRAREIPRKVMEVFEEADFIVHAGDLVDMSVIDELERLAPVLAVYGNMDGPKIRGRLPKTNSAKIVKWKIGVMHNPGSMFGMKKMREIAKENNFDVFVYGHTHNSRIKWEGKKLYINPGSPTNPVPAHINKSSVAVLTVTKEAIVPEIVHL